VLVGRHANLGVTRTNTVVGLSGGLNGAFADSGFRCKHHEEHFCDLVRGSNWPAALPHVVAKVTDPSNSPVQLEHQEFALSTSNVQQQHKLFKRFLGRKEPQ
jgi:hypothetical protein